MKKGKEWAQEQVNFYKECVGEPWNGYTRGLNVGYRAAESIISQLEEPEKPVVPQFVADRIEEYKEIQFGISLIFMINRQIDDDVRFSKWLSSDKDNCELVCRSFLDGYTIEKEKLYQVKVDRGPNYLYVESLQLYKDVIEPLDFYYKFSVKENALKFSSRIQAKGVAELVGGEVEEVTE